LVTLIVTNFASPNNGTAKESTVKAIFQNNENGQTYGSGLDATSPDSEPDLIKAYGVDGTIGYVRSKDLIGEMPKTPEEALSKQRRMAPGSVHQIPLYDVDGKKVIGVFKVG
jgi:hypothetical protein